MESLKRLLTIVILCSLILNCSVVHGSENQHPIPFQIATSYGSTLILLDNGQVLGCGLNDYKQISPYHDDYIWSPVTISGLANVNQVEQHSSLSYALVDNNRIVQWGSVFGTVQHGNISSKEVIRIIEEPEVILEYNDIKSFDLSSIYYNYILIQTMNNKLVAYNIETSEVIELPQYNNTVKTVRMRNCSYSLTEGGEVNYYDYTTNESTLVTGLRNVVEMKKDPMNDSISFLTSSGVIYVYKWDDEVLTTYELENKNVIDYEFCESDIFLLTNDGIYQTDYNSRDGYVYSKTYSAYDLKSIEVYKNDGVTDTLHLFVIDNDGYIYSLGNNRYGELGLGKEIILEQPRKLDLPQTAVDIALGGDDALFLMKDGSLYTVDASNNLDLIGGPEQSIDWTRNDDQIIHDTPVKINTNIRFENIYAFRTTFYGCGTDGQFYNWDSNRYYYDTGLTNYGDSDRAPFTPIFVQNSPVVKVGFGQYNVVVLLENGDVYEWGLPVNDEYIYSNVGRETDYGLGSNYSRKVLSNAVDIYADILTNFAVLEDGSTVVWGNNNYGSFGDGTYGNSSFQPIENNQLSVFDEIINVDATLFGIKDDGSLSYWGHIYPNENEANTLGYDRIMLELEPVIYEGLSDVKDVVGDFVLLNNGDLIPILDSYEYVHMYNGNYTRNWFVDESVFLTNVDKVYCSYDKTEYAAIMKSGTVMIWEDKNYSEYTEPVFLEGLQNVIKVESNDRSSWTNDFICWYALTEDGDVYSWGNNLRGTCGLGYDSEEEEFVMMDYNPEDFIQPIIFKLNSNVLNISRKVVHMDAEPYVVEGRTMVPIRFAAEALGAEVRWIGDENKIIITKGFKTIEMVLGNNQAIVNGINKYIDPNNINIIPEVSGGRTYVPIRFIAENLDCTVEWIGTTQEIIIEAD